MEGGRHVNINISVGCFWREGDCQSVSSNDLFFRFGWKFFSDHEAGRTLLFKNPVGVFILRQLFLPLPFSEPVAPF